MNSACDDLALPRPGCPIRKPSDQSLLSGSPKHIAASHVLHRLLAPRHSPCALSSLTMLATIHPAGCRMDRRNTQVSYHALALLELPFRFSKTVTSLVGPRTAAMRSPTVPGGTIGHRSATMELMGIEPTTSGLQSRRSPS